MVSRLQHNTAQIQTNQRNKVQYRCVAYLTGKSQICNIPDCKLQESLPCSVIEEQFGFWYVGMSQLHPEKIFFLSMFLQDYFKLESFIPSLSGVILSLFCCFFFLFSFLSFCLFILTVGSTNYLNVIAPECFRRVLYMGELDNSP